MGRLGVVATLIIAVLSGACVLAQSVAHAAPLTVTCTPGAPTWLGGRGPVGAGILLAWESRTVSGSVTRADGTWRVPVMVAADQASGSYPVAVTDRASGAVLGAWICQVVNTSLPTPGHWQSPMPLPSASATVPPTSTPVPTSTNAPTAISVATVAPTSIPTSTGAPTATSAATAAPTATSGTSTSSTSSAACTVVCIDMAEASTTDAPGYLLLSNASSAAVSLGGWTLRSSNGAITTLGGSASIAAGDSVLVWCMAGADDDTGGVYWPDTTLATNDVVTLLDGSGATVQQFTMPASTDGEQR